MICNLPNLPKFSPARILCYTVHLFILSYLSLFLCGLYNICKFYYIPREIFDKVLCMLGKKLFNLKGSKLGQNLHADKTGFLRDSVTFLDFNLNSLIINK